MGSVLVTGGAGFIGSHTCVELLARGRDIVVLDNFSNSTREALEAIRQISGKTVQLVEADIEKDALDSKLSSHRIDGVVHFAALKSASESIVHPQRYYDVNVVGTLRVLEWMVNNGIKDIVFSSSATVYGHPKSCPIKEGALLSPINPYGQTKLIGEQMIRDVAASHGLRYALLRYFNPAGAHESGLMGEAPTSTPSNLFPYVSGVLRGEYPHLRVFGSDYPTRDGTGVRDYIHVMDLAEVHCVALSALESLGSFCVNVGTGRGYSVLEVVNAFEEASGRKVPLAKLDRRPGDSAECYADTSMCESLLDWRAKRGLHDMCRDTIRWIEQPGT